MSLTIDLPESADLMEVLQNLLPVELSKRQLLKLFPIRTTDAAKVIWDQLDDYVGLQQVRGVEGAPSKVKHTGAKRYAMEPGYYGEFEVLGEKYLTESAELGTFADPKDIDKEVGRLTLKLTQRELDRIETTISTLARTGTFTNTDDTGGIVHTDKFPIQSFTPGTAWTDTANSTPLSDIRTFIQTAESKGSFVFGPESELVCNRATLNQLLANRNLNDLWGLRSNYGSTTLNSLDDLNKVLIANDLPSIRVYNRWYKTDAGVVTYIIPNQYMIWVGSRPNGEQIGAYQVTRNINGETAGLGAGVEGEATTFGYFKIIDRGANQVPRSIEVHRGHNGGPVLFFPSAVACISW